VESGRGALRADDAAPAAPAVEAFGICVEHWKVPSLATRRFLQSAMVLDSLARYFTVLMCSPGT
jgi:hypothetical protein